ncbi:sugar ABC transporter permease [Actinomadura madurae]|uniref:carbohydrate ABC transporter permease n=2 Tax=Actinomadura madurae TaxID=1993 RepID=UPI0020263E9E|nr:sugar ABC transporter permease [Actinomadura madurae]MCP9949160.1 sugar ABC transporter permease [Actinomadura madurae]URM94734.1 sugar ABC transporter permease [Actinomadura madurae]URN05447.1 sugar ABC transporter permease [Actinomadura madurae]
MTTTRNQRPSAAGTPAAGAPRGRRRDVQGTKRLAALLLSPTLLVLALVIGYPVLAGFRESLYARGEGLDAEGFVVEGDRFVGLDNYTAIFQGDRAGAFWNAFGNTTFFTLTTVVLETVIGVAMALIMHRAFRGRAIVRASILVPWAVPTAISGLLWRWIFQADGAANAVLRREILWTADGFPAKMAVVIAEVWKTSPFIGLLVLAGLQMIPRDVYEAARVDGAGPVQQFWRITLPLVKPALLVAVLFRMLDVLRMFDLPAVLIGVNQRSVETLTMIAWFEASNLRYGSAAAYATVLFLYIALIAYLFVKLLGADIIGEARQHTRRERGSRPVKGTRRAA